MDSGNVDPSFPSGSGWAGRGCSSRFPRGRTAFGCCLWNAECTQMYRDCQWDVEVYSWQCFVLLSYSGHTGHGRNSVCVSHRAQGICSPMSACSRLQNSQVGGQRHPHSTASRGWIHTSLQNGIFAGSFDHDKTQQQILHQLQPWSKSCCSKEEK